MGDTDEHEDRADNHSQRQGQPYKSPVFVTIEAISVTGLLILGYMFATNPAHRNTAIWIFFAAYVLVGFFAALYLTKPSPNELDKSKQPALSTHEAMKDDRSNKSISTVNQSGGQNIIADSINVGPPPPVPINFPDQKAELLKTLLGAPTIESIDLVTYDDSDSMNLCQKLRYAFGNWKIVQATLVGTAIPPFASGVTIRYSDARQSKQVDAIVKALHDSGLPSRKENSPSTARVTLEINGLKQPNE